MDPSQSSNAPSSSTTTSSAPQDYSSFSENPNVSFDKTTGKWQYEAEDGTEFEYDVLARAWVPVIDEELVKAQQAAYSVAGVDEEAPAAPVAARAKKRKEVDYTSNTATPAPLESGAGPSSSKRGKKNAKGDKLPPASSTEASSSSAPPPAPPSKNTAVYVTGLPPDTTASELAARFGKFGVLMEDDSGQPKIKLYADESTGQFNGEALVVYFIEDSVDLAITMLDEAELRLGEPGTSMRVRKAEFGHKGSGADHEGKATVPVRRTVDKKKATARINKMKSKLADWDSSDEEDPRAKEPVSKSRSVLLKYMFTPADIEKDPALLLDLKDDVREECETLGEVTNIVLYDLEADGIMTVKFKDPVSAQACVIKMNNRFFDGRQVSATLFDGKGTKFKRSDRGGPIVVDGDEEGEGESEEGEKKRLDAFASWLESGGETKGNGKEAQVGPSAT